METCKLGTYVLGFGLLFVSCTWDDTHRTSHPAHGALKVTTDWTARTAEAVLPDIYYLRVGTAQQAVTEKTNAFASLLNPGIYDLLAYNMPQGMTLTATTASVNLQEDGTLNPLPGFLFTATGSLDVLPDDTLHVTLPMRQYTRTLILTLSLTEGDDLLIVRSDATLTGVASQVEFLTGKLTGADNVNVSPQFSIIQGADVVKRAGTTTATLIATLRLLGVRTDKKQLFTLVITMTNGQVQTIVTDLTELLKKLATATTPLVLDARLNLLVEANAESTITDWVMSGGQSSEAN